MIRASASLFSLCTAHPRPSPDHQEPPSGSSENRLVPMECPIEPLGFVQPLDLRENAVREIRFGKIRAGDIGARQVGPVRIPAIVIVNSAVL